MVAKYKNRGILDNVSKKGFTLIELLAVIVILAVIALIATPIILNMINSARKEAAKDSTYGYIDAIEKNNTLALMNQKYSLIETSDVDLINDTLKIKGTLPISGEVIINKGRVIELVDFCIDNYIMDYDGSKVTISGSCKNGMDFHGNFSATLTDSKSNLLSGKIVVLFDNKLKYAMTSENGYFYINDISSGNYEVYILNKSLKEVKKMTKDEIKQNSQSEGVLNTKNKKLSLKNINASNIKLSTNNKLLKNESWNFDYIGSEDEFEILESGNYKLETWGSSGWGMQNIGHMEYKGGFGGYSVGNVQLSYNKTLYINVGGVGDKPCLTLYCKGGYNGGGRAAGHSYPIYSSPGGGATHIATNSGLLSSLSSKIDSILIVAGGGGGVSFQIYSDGKTYSGSGGSGGGYIGVNGTSTQSGFGFGSGGSQTNGGISGGGEAYGEIRGNSGSFGQGGDGNYYSSGGGGGFYGGGASNQSGSGGGSGYIGNPLLTDKSMYCYKCDESNVESTKTISTENVSEFPKSNYAKKGNGYAKITYLGN